MKKNSDFIPLSLYIHIPWCIKKCPYCDFNSHTAPTTVAEKAYIEALVNDLRQDLCLVQGRSLSSIFIGGGTPSLLSANSYQDLFAKLRSLIPWDDAIEITLEANPGTVDQQNFYGYKEVGINRLSLGVQSFQNDKLQTLGRIHNAEKAMLAIDAAKQAGFSNFNLDLMFGLPQQTLADALYDINTAVGFNPTHLSWYQLTLEPNTIFYKKPPTLPAEDQLWEIEQQGRALISKNFTPYEISAYCKPNYHSRHNLNYWLFGDYLGIGAGAHAKLTTNDGQVVRLQKVRQPQDYLNPNKSFIAKQWQVANGELAFEFMLNSLRLMQAIPWQLFEYRTGLNREVLQNIVDKAQAQGLLISNQDYLQTTELGKRYLNNLQQMFV